MASAGLTPSGLFSLCQFVGTTVSVNDCAWKNILRNLENAGVAEEFVSRGDNLSDTASNKQSNYQNAADRILKMYPLTDIETYYLRELFQCVHSPTVLGVARAGYLSGRILKITSRTYRDPSVTCQYGAYAVFAGFNLGIAETFTNGSRTIIPITPGQVTGYLR